MPPLPMPAGGIGISGGVGLPRPPAHELNLAPKPPDLRIDLNWLDLDEFFPPGGRRVGPTSHLTVELAPARRVRFPTAELCPSPDNRFVLFHDGMKRKQRDIFHWLMLLKNESTAYPNAIFSTRMSFDAEWAEDSKRFAVTHYIGHNSSEVFVVDPAALARKPIEVRSFIEEHFPPHLAAVPMFIKAYRWTRDGQLIVRAMARATEEPYELFGCEIATTFTSLDGEPKTRFLRGFIKPQENAAQ